MAINHITSEEYAQFKSINRSQKIDAMEMYLIGDDGNRKYNMQEVGLYVFGDVNYSFTVSLIHRCYNFAGQNGGKYRKGCKFERTYGYRVTRKDLEDFIGKYPNGTFENGVTFEDFLIARVENARNSVSMGNGNGHPTNDNNNSVNNDADSVIGCGSISLFILVIMFFKGWLFEHWVISLILCFCVFAGISALKSKEE